MTISEFSDGFDVLLASYSQQRIYGLTDTPVELAFDEYEKSLFLTEAQKLVVKESYESPSGISSFESEEKIRRALEALIKQQDYTNNLRSATALKDNFKHFIYTLDDDCWYIVYEQVTFQSKTECLQNKVAEVLPVKHDDYHRIKENPFRGPNDRKVLRLDIGNQQVEIISKNDIDTYTVRYLAMPEPIILVPLEGRLAIQGKTDPQTCKLNSSLHQIILHKAVQLALESKVQSKTSN